MEGLAITPDGKMLVGVMQAPLIQDGGKIIRIVTFDLPSGKTHQYAYKLTTGSGVSEILAINNTQFLVDERDGKGLGDGPPGTAAVAKQIFKIDLDGAEDVSDISGAANLMPKAVAKTPFPFLDVVAALTKAGIADIHIPAKLEGMAFGQDVTLDGVTKHTLYIATDNDFSATAQDKNLVIVDNPNQFFVFAFDDNDLPGFLPQSFIGDRFGDRAQ